ncbi:MAG: hypothetical protein QOE25_83 [Actinomycetota bacterium]|nr:hypothetical protein [Actinomycetota bacterium]
MAPIDDLLTRMDLLLEPMREMGDERRHFLAVYRRTTIAVKREIELGGFLDAEWTERWDIVFADLYLDALRTWNDEGTAPGPWQIAFEGANATPRVPPIRHLLLGMNAHINYDLPQALLAVITDDEFDDAGLIARRAVDHTHIDSILASRVPQEDSLLKRDELPGDRTAVDTLLTPFNRAGTKRFLREARDKVWRNAKALSAARRQGSATLEARIHELGELSAARVEDLRRPGQVILRLAKDGFGVVLDGA